jgi:hypothetical protein
MAPVAACLVAQGDDDRAAAGDPLHLPIEDSQLGRIDAIVGRVHGQ